MWPDFLASEPGRPVRVILIDDDPHIRRVIAGELVSDMRIDMVGQADGLREGRRLVSMCEFDVMIVDLNLGDGSGFDLIEHMKQVRPQAEAIVVSIMDDEVRAMRAFELGATGYLVKNSWFGSFTQAVLQVFNGGASITPSLARRLLQKLEQPMGQLPATERDGSVRQALSEREREVLRLVSVGHTSNEIATKLTLSVQTVNTHIRNIYRKLHVKSRAQAVNLAAHQRLI
ncbi:MAG: DNA-binding response regulator [Burkholderiales bacterium GWF1_66_17]|nr:response regulator transcription factor [Hydrogenophaga sp.]MCG2656395.1 response regulator transcription factor [Hydrogenophaga sp.]OGA73696.1 MAG: DNA-binding response regulator [Burkholderiales bacterium GWE1_65_30]OGA93028.1 MAG: DNA-binding response regulator [Burkholderiales bacterium GWF1_66_17]